MGLAKMQIVQFDDAPDESEPEVEVRAPVYKIHGEDYEYLFEQIRVNGYRRARIDGKPRDLGDNIELDEDEAHTVEAVIDSFVVGHGIDALLIAYGVMAAGAVLVPIDAAEPVERMALIHRAGGANLAVSTAAHADRTRAATGCRVLLLDDPRHRSVGPPDDAPVAGRIHPASPASHTRVGDSPTRIRACRWMAVRRRGWQLERSASWRGAMLCGRVRRGRNGLLGGGARE